MFRDPDKGIPNHPPSQGDFRARGGKSAPRRDMASDFFDFIPAVC
jgi:hypothetical protein